MTDTTPPPAPRWLAFAPAIALVLTLCGALLTGGEYISTQARHTREIEELRKHDTEDRERREERITDIRERTIRIEARLDALVPDDRKPGR
ncbi:hypothetical protein [Sphingomonas sp. Leaf62]|uniref:hypothetical protein n=1 Tax=Sphingomonas sp. Leaf62 TaxID=1736228 RepID=UPI000700EA0A|nr:hypothetical protein [Sphingomonas sp. Leaf62]KQN77885.1 hypothetical protein ASE91_14300 [Sphingomonas sp. Leaf62]